MKKILLLDDNLDIVQVVEEVLAYEHYEVRSTTTCDSFLSLVELFRPDLIILDYRLSDGNGGELCQTIKENSEFRNIPVIIFSAYTQPGLDLMCFGCDTVISKPFDLDYLTSTINHLLNKPNSSPSAIATDLLMSESMEQELVEEKQRLRNNKHC